MNPQQCNGDLLFVLRKMQSRILDEKQEILTPTPMSAPKAPPLTATEDWIHRIDRTLSSLEQCVSVTSGAYKKGNGKQVRYNHGIDLFHTFIRV